MNITSETGMLLEYTSDVANTIAHAHYVHVETRVERYVRFSNEWADTAAIRMENEFGEALVEHAASLADHWADLAAACRFLELALERLP